MISPEREKHILEAALLSFDLTAHVNALKAEKTWESSSRNSITLVKTPSVRIVLMLLHAGAGVPALQHAEGSISFLVLSGSVELLTPEKTTHLKASSLLYLEEGALHSVRSVEESIVLLTVIPKGEIGLS